MSDTMKIRHKHSLPANSERNITRQKGSDQAKHASSRGGVGVLSHLLPCVAGLVALILTDLLFFQIPIVQNGGRFAINSGRLIFLALLIAFFIVFRPSAHLYRVRSDTRSIWQNITIIVLILVFTALCGTIAFIGHYYMNTYVPTMGHWFNSEQYETLARSLIHGHTWLDLKVDPALTRMANPYSFSQRVRLARQGHVFFYDHAYFAGHYYCYFGVVPALLFFVPYRLLTGRDLPVAAALTLFIALIAVFGSLLVRRLARDFFPDASFGVVLLGIFGLWLGSMTIYYASSSDTYSIPMAAATGLVYAGLWCWLASKRRDGTVNSWLACLGSLFLALEIGTRPQFALSWFLVIPVFWRQITQRHTLFSGKSIAASILLVMPFLLVGGGVAAYNYVRFRSPFNFGNDYNLTNYDVANAKAKPGLLPIQIFDQLFQPPWISNKFPFLQPVDNSLPAAHGVSFSGYFAIIPFCLLAILVFFLHRRLAGRGLWGLGLTMMLLSPIPLVFDMLKGSNFVRYSGDFAYLVSLSAVIVLLLLETETRHEKTLSSSAQGRNRTAGRCDDGLAIPGTAFRLVIIAVLMLLVFSAGFQLLDCFLITHRQSAWNIRYPQLFRKVKGWFTITG